MRKHFTTILSFFIYLSLVSSANAFDCLSLKDSKILNIDRETVFTNNACTDEQIRNDLELYNTPISQGNIVTTSYVFDLSNIGVAHTLLNTPHGPSGSDIYRAEDLIKILNYHTDFGAEEVYIGTITTEELKTDDAGIDFKEIITKSFVIIFDKAKTNILNFEKIISIEEVEVTNDDDNDNGNYDGSSDDDNDNSDGSGDQNDNGDNPSPIPPTINFKKQKSDFI